MSRSVRQLAAGLGQAAASGETGLPGTLDTPPPVELTTVRGPCAPTGRRAAAESLALAPGLADRPHDVGPADHADRAAVAHDWDPLDAVADEALGDLFDRRLLGHGGDRAGHHLVDLVAGAL